MQDIELTVGFDCGYTGRHNVGHTLALKLGLASEVATKDYANGLSIIHGKWCRVALDEIMRLALGVAVQAARGTSQFLKTPHLLGTVFTAYRSEDARGLKVVLADLRFRSVEHP